MNLRCGEYEQLWLVTIRTGFVPLLMFTVEPSCCYEKGGWCPFRSLLC